MAKGTVNKVIIMGRLGADPEVRYMPSGNAVANVNIATNDGYKDKQTGQYIDVTEWHRVVIFNKMAEVVQQYCKKGSQLYVEGRIRTNKWTDQTGVDRYTTEIVANEIQLMGGSLQGSHNPPVDSYEQNHIATPSSQSLAQTTTPNNDYARAKGERPSNGNHQGNLPTPENMATATGGFEDDDLPF
ncbi:single-stranded DNA-binding protein [Cysteiniphilum halobium]|uniref:single-stranded DNA-binding protein n=1 Tax=Cysteiniphilum halobium TaxID=2219059 RepID=UPI000E65B205|nr:single-stranded DNA-binding protein [Cysteiniphilum halobium]